MRLAGLLALALGAVACSYSPSFESGTLGCGTNRSCPQGYECQADNKCWKKGEVPSDGGSDASHDVARDGTGGSGGDASNPALKFIGHWVFDSTGKLDETCNNIAQPSMPLASGDYIDITAGTVTPLVGSYYCPWNLSLAAADKTRTVIMPGQSCQTTSGGQNINMTGDAFDFQTTDGATATVTASFTAIYTSGSALTCTFKITGKLNSMP